MVISEKVMSLENNTCGDQTLPTTCSCSLDKKCSYTVSSRQIMSCYCASCDAVGETMQKKKIFRYHSVQRY